MPRALPAIATAAAVVATNRCWVTRARVEPGPPSNGYHLEGRVPPRPLEGRLPRRPLDRGGARPSIESSPSGPGGTGPSMESLPSGQGGTRPPIEWLQSGRTRSAASAPGPGGNRALHRTMSLGEQAIRSFVEGRTGVVAPQAGCCSAKAPASWRTPNAARVRRRRAESRQRMDCRGLLPVGVYDSVDVNAAV